MKRTEIDFINVVLCMLVIFIHIMSETVETLGADGLVVYSLWRTAGFAVYGFVFLSGLKNSMSEKFDYRYFYARRFTKILIPYVIWVTAYYIAYCVCGRYDKFSITQLLGFIIRGDAAAHFYFITVIIQFYLLMPLWRFICRRFSAVSVISAAALITVMSQESLNGILNFFLPLEVRLENGMCFTNYLVFWLAGCFCGMRYDAFKERLSRGRRLMLAAFILLAAEECVSGLASLRGESVPTMTGMHVLYCLCAVMTLTAFSAGRGKSRIVKRLSSAAYYIYLSHCLVLYFAQLWANSHEITDLTARFAVTAVPTVVISVSVCVLYSAVKQKILTRNNN